MIFLSSGDGRIDPIEMKEVLNTCVTESSMRFSDDHLEQLVLAIFQEAHTDEKGDISFEALKAVLDKHPDIWENLKIRLVKALLVP